MKIKRNTSGFTLMETIIVLAITGVFLGLTIPAISYLKSNNNYEQTTAERVINDSVVGYYSVLGIYPEEASLGVSSSMTEMKLTDEQVSYIVKELKKYSGFAYVPAELLKRYDFYLYYPNKYVFKIRTEIKAPTGT